MLNRYRGNVIRSTPITANKLTASGVFSLAEQFQLRGADSWPNGVSLTFIAGATGQTGSTVTYTGVSFGAAAPDRLVVVGVCSARVGNQTISSATIGGVAATVALEATAGSNNNAAIIYAIVPTGTSGSVVINFTAAPSFTAIATYVAYGQTSTTPNNTGTAAGGGLGSRAVTVTVPLGGFAIVVAGEGIGSWTNATGDYVVAAANNAMMGSVGISSTLQTGLVITNSSCRCICAAAWV